jgi:putative Holliday junction resolvase
MSSASPPPSLRCLGIDYGTRRIGLAYGDELGVATPLPALVGSDPAQRWAALAAVIRQRRITDLVLGQPLNMDGTEGPMAREVSALAARLRTEFGLPVHLADERLTSYEAEATIPPSRRRALRASGLVDSRAAALVLADYLDERLRPPPEPVLPLPSSPPPPPPPSPLASAASPASPAPPSSLPPAGPRDSTPP